jgi:hypothetical protein
MANCTAAGCGVRIDAEELEAEGHQQRIERRKPGGGAGGAVERAAIAAAQNEGARDTTGLKAELPMVVGRADAIGVADEDAGHPKCETDPEDDPGSAEVEATDGGLWHGWQ